MNKLITYINESKIEFKEKVTWPSWDDLLNTVMIVIVASLAISLVIWGMDQLINAVLQNTIYKM